MSVIREPAGAGLFYAGQAKELALVVNALLGGVPDLDTSAPKALIVPHAGYAYSGAVAASAYARLMPYRDQYRQVVLLGPSHHLPVSGVALSSADVYRTPLGDVPLDKPAIASLNIPGVRVDDAPHRFEHSLEVHLPFLQTVLGSFALVPLVIGDASPQLVADVIDALWDGPESLIIVSSDLSHYRSYETARALDTETCRAIESLDADGIDHAMACGAAPVCALLLIARHRKLQVTTLDLRNSGDTQGERGAVVGYGAWIFN